MVYDFRGYKFCFLIASKPLIYSAFLKSSLRKGRGNFALLKNREKVVKIVFSDFEKMRLSCLATLGSCWKHIAG